MDTRSTPSDSLKHRFPRSHGDRDLYCHRMKYNNIITILFLCLLPYTLLPCASPVGTIPWLEGILSRYRSINKGNVLTPLQTSLKENISSLQRCTGSVVGIPIVSAGYDEKCITQNKQSFSLYFC